MYIPQDPPLVLHLPTSWRLVHSWSCPHILLQRWGCQDSNSCSQNICESDALSTELNRDRLVSFRKWSNLLFPGLILNLRKLSRTDLHFSKSYSNSFLLSLHKEPLTRLTLPEILTMESWTFSTFPFSPHLDLLSSVSLMMATFNYSLYTTHAESLNVIRKNLVWEILKNL